MPFLWTLSGHPAWVAFLSMAGALLWGGLNLARRTSSTTR